MRAAIFVALIGAALPLSQACVGGSAEPASTAVTDRSEVDFSVLPRDEKALSDLNFRQRRMIRRAQTRCGAEGGSGMVWRWEGLAQESFGRDWLPRPGR